MIYLKDFKQGAILYDALASDVRLGILDELLNNGELNLAYFAKKFNVSNGAITAHIRKLYEAGLIEIATSSGTRGTQKICSLATDKIIIDFKNQLKTSDRVESAEIGVGNYVDYEVEPTCGLATRDGVIGRFDDPACFTYSERTEAGILWIGSGYVEYLIPNFLNTESRLSEIQISAELASEAPGYAAFYPSDIHFSVNGETVGYYTSKGEYNDRAGNSSPSWWFGNLGQYGKKVRIAINDEGSYIGGIKVSEKTLRDYKIEQGKQIRFRIFIPDNAEHKGGFTLFGKGFGDYNEGIVCNFVSK